MGGGGFLFICLFVIFCFVLFVFFLIPNLSLDIAKRKTYKERGSERGSGKSETETERGSGMETERERASER